jgi:hypothetical protein
MARPASLLRLPGPLCLVLGSFSLVSTSRALPLIGVAIEVAVLVGFLGYAISGRRRL